MIFFFNIGRNDTSIGTGTNDMLYCIILYPICFAHWYAKGDAIILPPVLRVGVVGVVATATAGADGGAEEAGEEKEGAAAAVVVVVAAAVDVVVVVVAV
jgi:hypothetical protein